MSREVPPSRGGRGERQGFRDSRGRIVATSRGRIGGPAGYRNLAGAESWESRAETWDGRAESWESRAESWESRAESWNSRAGPRDGGGRAGRTPSRGKNRGHPERESRSWHKSQGHRQYHIFGRNSTRASGGSGALGGDPCTPVVRASRGSVGPASTDVSPYREGLPIFFRIRLLTPQDLVATLPISRVYSIEPPGLP